MEGENRGIKRKSGRGSGGYYTIGQTDIRIKNQTDKQATGWGLGGGGGGGKQKPELIIKEKETEEGTGEMCKID